MYLCHLAASLFLCQCRACFEGFAVQRDEFFLRRTHLFTQRLFNNIHRDEILASQISAEDDHVHDLFGTQLISHLNTGNGDISDVVAGRRAGSFEAFERGLGIIAKEIIG